MPGLTKKQEAFAVAYIKSGNASKAYRYAYDAKRMTSKQINEEACKLAAHHKVSQRIEELRAPAMAATKLDLERWAQEVSKYAVAAPSTRLKHADKRGYLDMAGRSLGAYKEDNLQRGESIALKVVEAARTKR